MKKFFLLLLLTCFTLYSGFAQSLSASPSFLYTFTTVVSTSSPLETTTITGYYLTPATGNLTVTAPTNFMVSHDGATFTTSYVVSYTGGFYSGSLIASCTPTSVTSYGGNITVTGGGTSALTIPITGRGAAACSSAPAAGTVVTSTSSICTSGSLLSLTDTTFTTSTGGIALQWQSSPDSSTWTNISGATNPFVSLSFGSTSTYYKCIASCSFSGLSNSTPLAGVRYGGGTCPVFTDTPTFLSFPYTAVSYSSWPQTTSVSGLYLTPGTGNLTITAPSGFSISPDGTTWVTSYAISYTGGALSPTTINVQFDPTSVYAYSGDVILSGGGAPDLLIPVSGTGTGYTCSSTPSAGLATASVTLASSVTPITLTATGFTVAGGISVQWQSSPDSSTWTNVTGATTTPYSFTGITGNTYYRMSDSCSASGGIAYSPGILITYGTTCSGTPTAGTISATSYHLCSSTFDTLTLSGYSSSADIAFQWQSSTDSSTWTNLSGGTRSMIAVAPTTTAYYRCVVQCTSSYLSASTPLVSVLYYGAGCPTLSGAPTALTFPATTATTSSAPEVTTLTGTSLAPATGTLTVMAPTNFKACSTRGGTFVTSYTIAYSGAATTDSVFVEFVAPSTPGTYSGNLTISGGGALDLLIPLNGTADSAACSGTPSAGTAATSVTMAGATTPITLTATGYTASGGIVLQWQSSPDGTTWTNISGATTSTWSFTGISATTWYRMAVTCSAGGSTVYTTASAITYAVPCSGTPSAGTPVSSPATVCTGTTVTISSPGCTVAPGTTYQWQSSPDSTTWTNIFGATDTSYTFVLTTSTIYYQLVVTCSAYSTSASAILVLSSAGCHTLVASPTSLSFPATARTMTSAPLGSVVNGTLLMPASGSITVTAPTNFLVSGSSTGTFASSYTITYTGAAASDSVFAEFVAPATTGTYSGNITLSGGGATLNIPVTGASGCTGTPSGGTSSATTSSAGCATTSVTLTNTGYTTGPGITLQWQSSPTGTGSWSTISGATNGTYTLSEAAATTYYNCVVTCTTSSTSTNSTTSSVAVDRINGHIAFSSTMPDTLSTLVWLIYHDTTAGTLTAIDSTVTCLDGGVPYYEFNGMGAGSFLVKAKSLDVTSTVPGSSGYIPTYGLSNPHWDTATVVNHTSPTDSMHINLLYGTVPSGPGFIGGYITSGAGRNTSGDIPAVNMTVYLMNTSNSVLTYVYTDGSGNYSFSGLGYGSYIIYPEALSYATTESAIITLTAATPTASGNNFKQHTTAKTITPVLTTNASNVTQTGDEVIIAPNPANNVLTIQMQAGAYTDLTITNSLGETVQQQPITAALTQLNLNQLAPGIYYIRFTGAGNTVVKKFVKM